MPGVSTNVHISQCVGHILGISPATVLDVGCGFGLWGFLCREYLDAWNSRIKPEEWATRIDGIEIFEPYIGAHHRALYSSIIIADIRDVAPNLGRYDLIITGDVIEHLPKDDAMDVLNTLYGKAKKALLVNIPIGDDGWDQPEVYGNAAEAHLSRWHPEDFYPFAPEMTAYQLPNGHYGVFLCRKGDRGGAEQRFALQVAQFRAAINNRPLALKAARRAYEINGKDQEAVLLLTNLLIQTGDVQEAIHTLEEAIAAAPLFYEAYSALGQLLLSLGAVERGRRYLSDLLALAGLPSDIAARAKGLLA